MRFIVYVGAVLKLNIPDEENSDILYEIADTVKEKMAGLSDEDTYEINRAINLETGEIISRL